MHTCIGTDDVTEASACDLLHRQQPRCCVLAKNTIGPCGTLQKRTHDFDMSLKQTDGIEA